MDEDFFDAYQRHWADAEYLFKVSQWANADHLFGLAAECGLKALIEKMTKTRIKREDRLHIMEEKIPNNAWIKFQSYASGRLATKLTLPEDNPFTDWLVSQRYAHRSNFDQRRTEVHRQGTLIVANLIKTAEKEGLL